MFYGFSLRHPGEKLALLRRGELTYTWVPGSLPKRVLSRLLSLNHYSIVIDGDEPASSVFIQTEW